MGLGESCERRLDDRAYVKSYPVCLADAREEERRPMRTDT